MQILNLFNLLSWIIFGVIIGVVSYVIDPVDNFRGMLGTIILGILGALVGGLIANLVVGANGVGFNFLAFIIAVLGSLLVVFAQRVVKKI